MSTLTPGAIVTTSKNDVDRIVTEYGIAELRGRILSQRAKALISIAHPDHRDRLTFDAKKRNTAINLAEEFGVSERAIRTDLTILSCYYPVQVLRGHYGGGIQLPDWFQMESRRLSPKQEALLRRLRTSLDEEDLQVMNSILAQFALYWEYR